MTASAARRKGLGLVGLQEEAVAVAVGVVDEADAVDHVRREAAAEATVGAAEEVARQEADEVAGRVDAYTIFAVEPIRPLRPWALGAARNSVPA